MTSTIVVDSYSPSIRHKSEDQFLVVLLELHRAVDRLPLLSCWSATRPELVQHQGVITHAQQVLADWRIEARTQFGPKYRKWHHNEECFLVYIHTCIETLLDFLDPYSSEETENYITFLFLQQRLMSALGNTTRVQTLQKGLPDVSLEQEHAKLRWHLARLYQRWDQALVQLASTLENDEINLTELIVLPGQS